MKKPKKYTVLYIFELLYPIVFGLGIVALLLMFYFRLMDDTEKVQHSSPLELMPAVVMLGAVVFFILYAACRVVTLDDDGVHYRDLRHKYFLPWEDVKYVKITYNGNDKVGRGSYMVLSSDQYPIQHSDFRASQSDFIVFRYRISALSHISEHYKGEIIRARK